MIYVVFARSQNDMRQIVSLLMCPKVLEFGLKPRFKSESLTHLNLFDPSDELVSFIRALPQVLMVGRKPTIEEQHADLEKRKQGLPITQELLKAESERV